MIALNNVIIINRGDSFTFDVPIRLSPKDEVLYAPTGNDAIYFGLMDPRQPFECALVRKKFTADQVGKDCSLAITITPEDTLDLVPGKYYYAIKLRLDHPELGDDWKPTGKTVSGVITLINKTKFIICD